MNYYIYNTADNLGDEPVGSSGRAVLHDCTMRKVNNYINNSNWKTYSVYSFINFYNNSTFKLITRKNNGT